MSSAPRASDGPTRKESRQRARELRRAAEEAALKQGLKRRRLMWLGGIAGVVAVAIAVLVVVAPGATTREAEGPAQKAIDALLRGIPQHGNVLGDADAPVTMTEFGDLACPYCQLFSLTTEAQLIRTDVRAGRVKLVYRGLETASATDNNGSYVASQVAARAAGRQDREWYYILLWYAEQHSEQTPYMTAGFMRGIAEQVPELDLAKWRSDLGSAALALDVQADARAAATAQLESTPTVIFSGPKGTQPPLQSVPTYAQLQAEIAAVR